MPWPWSHSQVEAEFRFPDFKATAFSVHDSCLAPGSDTIVLISELFAELCWGDKQENLLAHDNPGLFSHSPCMKYTGWLRLYSMRSPSREKLKSQACCFRGRERVLVGHAVAPKASTRTQLRIGGCTSAHMLAKSKSYSQWGGECPAAPSTTPGRGPEG